jgi:hypothetical protein
MCSGTYAHPPKTARGHRALGSADSWRLVASPRPSGAVSGGRGAYSNLMAMGSQICPFVLTSAQPDPVRRTARGHRALGSA